MLLMGNLIKNKITVQKALTKGGILFILLFSKCLRAEVAQW